MNKLGHHYDDAKRLIYQEGGVGGGDGDGRPCRRAEDDDDVTKATGDASGYPVFGFGSAEVDARLWWMPLQDCQELVAQVWEKTSRVHATYS